jgi:DNA-binding LytR/AlgR family response regulator
VVAVSLIYTFFTFEGTQLGVIHPYLRNSGTVFLSALVYTAVCLCVPYALSSLAYALQDKDNTIRLMNYGNVVSDKPAVPYSDQRITLFDNNGVLKFSISSDNLYFIESDDNYIKAWYMDSGGEMKQYMLRCRLKTVEDSFADSELVRCHRKYIVNIRKISILKSEKEGYKIDFDIDSVDPIPISKTYEQAVLARFNSR